VTLALWALAGRIVLLGLERILLKALTSGRDPVATAALFFGIGALTLIPIWATLHSPFPDDPSLLVRPLAAVLIYSAAFALYVAALKVGDATIVAPLYHGNGFFILLLAVMFLGESLTLPKILGLMLIVGGAGVLEAEKGVPSPRRLLARQDARFMIASAALLAIGRVIDKGALDHFDPYTYALMTNMGIAFTLILVLAVQGKIRTLALAAERPWLTLATGAVNGVSYLMLLIALTQLDVSVAEPASGLSLIVTAILARIVFGEKMGWRLAGGIVLLGGVWLLFV
jgi:bacterial/archaeal transporter family protein